MYRHIPILLLTVSSIVFLPSFVSSLSVTAASYSYLLMVKRLKKSKSVAECLQLLPKDPPEKVLLEALQVCGQHKDLSTALKLLETTKASSFDSCRTLTISIAGKCGDYKTARRLLLPDSSLASHHTCLAACAKAIAWRDALEVYRTLTLTSETTTFTANIVLSAMAKAKRGAEALELYKELPNPDVQSTLKTMVALIGSNDLDAARELMEQFGPQPILVNRLVSAYAKANDWDMVQRLNPDDRSHFTPWKSLPKIGKGRLAHWKIGTFCKSNGDLELKVALQPHRNAAKNGMKLLLFDGTKKIGYLLMVNSRTESSLLGVYLDTSHRRHGLSKIFLAIWMRLCLSANMSPTTGVMNKPILCLSLQHTFGYIPGEGKGVDAEISPSSSDPNVICLYSPTKTIEGAFSPSDIRREQIQFLTKPAEPRGRTVRISSPLNPPSVATLTKTVYSALSSGSFEALQDGPQLKTILCGVEEGQSSSQQD